MSVVQHAGQVLCQLRLFERLVQYQAGVGLGNVMGVTTDCAHQYRQPGHQRFEQYGAGVFVVRRVDQQIGAQQETRNIAAPLEERHVVAKPQCRALHLEQFGVVLADYKQPGAFLQIGGQCRQRLEAAIDAFGLEPGADLHQQQFIVLKVEFGTEPGANFISIRWTATVLGDARWQQMEALQRRVVMFDEQRLLHFGNHQHFSLCVFGKHRAFVLGEVAIATPAAVQRVTQVLRLVFEATVGGVVDVQARHLVEADQTIHRTLGQVRFHPLAELFVATMVEERLDRRHQHFEPRRHVAFPDQRVDSDLVAALLALQSDAHEVALQATKRKVLVQDKCQLHQRSSSASNNVLSRLATRSGFRRVKHRGHSRLRSN
ncbi:hypothetical protein D3C81_946830 [compost metagenome]